MKGVKLVIGILSLVLFIFVIFQSCSAGLYNGITGDTEDMSGSAGLLLAACLLVGGISAIVGRKSKGGTIFAGIVYLLGGLIGINNGGIYKDLQVWAILCLVVGGVLLLLGIFGKKNAD